MKVFKNQFCQFYVFKIISGPKRLCACIYMIIFSLVCEAVVDNFYK